MKILTFDTSLNKTYITYGEDDNIIISKILNSDKEKYHSAFLVPELISIFKFQNITPKDIDVIGINIGPGSFTGIRICTVIARTLAQQAGIKVVPVSSLEILSLLNHSDKDSLILTDARKNKFYTALYSNDCVEIKSPYLTDKEDIINLLKYGDYKIITDTAAFHYLSEFGIDSINYEAEEYDLGQNLYKLTLNKLKSSNDFHWAKAKPLYIQPPSITKSKKKAV